LNESHKSSRRAIDDLAALWYARLDCGTADLGAFEAWRDADPQHAVAFVRVAAAASLLDQVREMKKDSTGNE